MLAVVKLPGFLWIIVSFIGAYCMLLGRNLRTLPPSSQFSFERMETVIPPTSELDHSRLQEIRKVLGCDENWDKCLLAASAFAKSKAVNAQQIATHRKEALQRALDGPTEYLSIKVFPDKHPVLVPLDPRYRPQPQWNTSLAIADVNIA